jgi:predicted nucleic acid-binding protein
MYLVDTSVLMDFLKGRATAQSDRFEQIMRQGIPFGISALTLQETLQGARDVHEYDRLRRYLSTQKIYYPTPATYESAARIFLDCRKSGITIRSTIDTLIAAIAIENDLILLTNDRDFLFMVGVVDLVVE